MLYLTIMNAASKGVIYFSGGFTGGACDFDVFKQIARFSLLDFRTAAVLDHTTTMPH